MKRLWPISIHFPSRAFENHELFNQDKVPHQEPPEYDEEALNFG
jgi:hypothetical protein